MSTAVKERPILFSGPMVKAILDGRKTQTRRVIGYCEPSKDFKLIDGRIWVALDEQQYDPRTGKTIFGGECRLEDNCLFYSPIVIGKGPRGEGNPATCPYGNPGGRIWVREAFYDRGDYATIGKHRDDRIVYVADGVRSGWRSHPSIHMPRWASRITLEITGVRVERLQEISESDAISEGVAPIENPDFDEGDPCDDEELSHKAAFAELWDSINGKKFPWESNPWVWVLSFKRVSP